MDEEDYRAVIEELARRLREIGADDVADESNYVVPNPNTGEGDLLPPYERLIEMLRAFERFLAVRDGRVAGAALDSIGSTLRASAETISPAVPTGAVVMLEGERDTTRNQVNLLDAPDLSPVRKEVLAFIQLLQSPDRTPPSDDSRIAR